MIVDMMQSCQLKDDPLVKHCLDFIAVVGGDDGGFRGVGPNLDGLSALSVAALTVHQVFIAAQDSRMQAVALRTLYALLSNPQCLAVDINFADAADSIFKAMRSSRKLRESTTKDVLCIQAFGLTVMGKLLDLADEGDNRASKPKPAAPLSMYLQDIHGAIAYIVRYICEGGEKISFEFVEDDPVVEVSCCRYACHCCFLHEPTKGRDVLVSVEGAAVCLLYCGDDALNSTDKDGFTILHRLAEAGLSECLDVYIREAGDNLDFLKRTKYGANALQLARNSKVLECVLVLEKATEAAAKAAQDALLQELEREGGKKDKLHTQQQQAHLKKQRNKKKGLPAPSGPAEVQEERKEEKRPKVSVQEKRAEEKRAEEERTRKEAECRRRQQEEEYERALEARRRQLEEQEKKMLQAAQEASLQEARQEKQQGPQVCASPKKQKPLANGNKFAEDPKLTPWQDNKSQKMGHSQKTAEPEPQKGAMPSKIGVNTKQPQPSPRSKTRGPGQTASQGPPSVQKRSSQHKLKKEGLPSKDAGTSANVQKQASKPLPVSEAPPPPAPAPSRAPPASAFSTPAAQAHKPICSPREPKQHKAWQSAPVPAGKPAQDSSQPQTSRSQPQLLACSSPQLPQSGHAETQSLQPSTTRPPEGGRAAAWSQVQQAETNRFESTTTSWQTAASSTPSHGLATDPHTGPWGHLRSGVPSQESAPEASHLQWAFSLPDLGGSEIGTHRQLVCSGHGPQVGSMGQLDGRWPDVSSMSMAPDAYQGGLSIGETFPPAQAPLLGPCPPQSGQECQLDNRTVRAEASESTATEWTRLRPADSGAQGDGLPHGSEFSQKDAGDRPAQDVDDIVDDSQIMSWLSSDIAGLILTENGGEKPAEPEATSGAQMDHGGHTEGELAQHDRRFLKGPQEWWTSPAPHSSPVTISSSASSPLTKTSPDANMSILGHGHHQMGIMEDNPEVWRTNPAMRPTGPALVYPPSAYTSMWAPQGSLPGETLLERGETKVASKHLWLGNLNTRLPRSILKSVFEEFGPVEDVVTFPGRMYAFVNFHLPEDAAKAAEVLDQKEVPSLTGNKKLVIKFRPNRKALGRVGDMLMGMADEDGRPVSEDVTGGEAPFAPPYGMALPQQAPVGPLPGSDLSSSRSAPSFHSWDETGEYSSTPLHKGGSAEWEGSSTPSNRVWLGNISPNANVSSIRSVFAKFGPITDVAVFPARIGPLGYAFVNFEKVADAVESYNTLNNVIVPTLTAAKQLKMRFKPAREACARWQQNGRRPEDLEEYDVEVEEPFSTEDEEGNIPEGRPSRHLWLGNVCLRPSKTVLFSLYSRYGPVESVRTFPGKTFAFVNFQQTQHAARAKEALDGEVVTAISGSKPLVVRFQKEGSGPPMWFKMDGRLGTRRGYRLEPAVGPDGRRPGMQSMSPNATKAWQMEQYTEEHGAEEGAPYTVDEMPQLNLSNRLNPNNVHFDGNLANRYKRMSKQEKEALWAEDRAQQRLSETLVNGSCRYMGLQDSSALEASSIGNLTRTLSAAALGNGRDEPGMDRAPSWGDNLMAAHYRGSGGPSMYGDLYSEEYGPYPCPMVVQDPQPGFPNQYRGVPRDPRLQHPVNPACLGREPNISDYPPVAGFHGPSPNLPHQPPGPSAAFGVSADHRARQPHGYFPGGRGRGRQAGHQFQAPREGHSRTPSDIYGSLPATLMPEPEGPPEAGPSYAGGRTMSRWGRAADAGLSSSASSAQPQGDVVGKQNGQDARGRNGSAGDARMW
eukprot:evm.model.scf_1230.2 EVM.evm.TU.scf_1230.2   scf_1230:33987-46976(-)